MARMARMARNAAATASLRARFAAAPMLLAEQMMAVEVPVATRRAVGERLAAAVEAVAADRLSTDPFGLMLGAFTDIMHLLEASAGGGKPRPVSLFDLVATPSGIRLAHLAAWHGDDSCLARLAASGADLTRACADGTPAELRRLRAVLVSGRGGTREPAAAMSRDDELMPAESAGDGDEADEATAKADDATAKADDATATADEATAKADEATANTLLSLACGPSTRADMAPFGDAPTRSGTSGDEPPRRIAKCFHTNGRRTVGDRGHSPIPRGTLGADFALSDVFDTDVPMCARLRRRLIASIERMVHVQPGASAGKFYGCGQGCCDGCRTCFKDQHRPVRLGTGDLRTLKRLIRLRACLDVGMVLRSKAGVRRGNRTNHGVAWRQQARLTCAVAPVMLDIARAIRVCGCE